MEVPRDRFDTVIPDHLSSPRFPSRSAYASCSNPTMHFRAHGGPDGSRSAVEIEAEHAPDAVRVGPDQPPREPERGLPEMKRLEVAKDRTIKEVGESMRRFMYE